MKKACPIDRSPGESIRVVVFVSSTVPSSRAGLYDALQEFLRCVLLYIFRYNPPNNITEQKKRLCSGCYINVFDS